MARGGYERREGAAKLVSHSRGRRSRSTCRAAPWPVVIRSKRRRFAAASVRRASAPREPASAEVAGRGSGAEPAIESVDQLRHPVEPLGDVANSDLLERSASAPSTCASVAITLSDCTGRFHDEDRSGQPADEPVSCARSR